MSETGKGGSKMNDVNMNSVIICNEDKDFICDLVHLSHEQKIFIKGIIVGINLQEKNRNKAINNLSD